MHLICMQICAVVRILTPRIEICYTERAKNLSPLIVRRQQIDLQPIRKNMMVFDPKLIGTDVPPFGCDLWPQLKAILKDGMGVWSSVVPIFLEEC